MDRNAAALLAPLHPEVESVLATITAQGPETSLKLNDLCGRTGLPTGHVGRHLRTLERDRLVRYSFGAWQPTLRGLRHAMFRADAIAATAATADVVAA
jgi:DNA-binding IclR family transcriptional regulator